MNLTPLVGGNSVDGRLPTRDSVLVNEIRERAVTLDDGAQLWTMSSGPTGGSPVVLCHGGPGMWDYLGPIATMVDSTHHVHRYDQRGCGRSTGPDDYRVDRAVADLDALRRQWDYDRWTVFGHSWGAALVLAYAWTHPEHVEAVIYCSGTGPGTEWRAPYYAEVAKRLTAKEQNRRDELEQQERSWDEEVEYRMLCWLPDYADPSRAEGWARAAASVPFEINWQANRELWCGQPDAITLATKVTAPTLIIHGEQDPRPLVNARRLLDIVPNASLGVIPNAGHLPWFEAPTAVSTRLNAFLTAYE
ncbi:MAG: proline iminopeptidase [Kribbellaceae bacterium]|jgi:proline iminopeptidase|nr:proline iminopeptidase [Kribbellaceae bacterium]